MLAPPGYTLKIRVLSGARSEIQLATRNADGLEVALKRCSAQDSARAARELEALRALDSAPGIRRGYELVQAQDATFLVLEALRGVSLEAWVRGRTPDPAAFLEVAIQLAGALDAVHAAHLIHHDINPGNVMVDPESLATHLIDFARARPLGGAHPRIETCARSDAEAC
jgi:serine/threonine protein kinase